MNSVISIEYYVQQPHFLIAFSATLLLCDLSRACNSLPIKKPDRIIEEAKCHISDLQAC